MASVCRFTVSATAAFHSGECGSVSLLPQGAIQLDRRLIQPQLDHGKIRRGLLQVLTQPQTRDLQLGLLELIKRVAEVHQKNVRLVTQYGKQGALPFDVMLHLFQGRGGFRGNLMPLCFRQLAPFGPAEADIWWSTLEPSIVSGTACSSFPISVISAFMLDAIRTPLLL